MAYQIEYAYTCHIGKVRNNNEDNFWCCGESLDSENKGMSHVCSGHIKQADLPLLAVFDGMGGESCGEMAAFLAAGVALIALTDKVMTKACSQENEEEE